MDNTLILSPDQPTMMQPAAAPAVYVDGLARADLEVTSLELSGPPLFGKAYLRLSCQDGSWSPQSALPTVGTAVLIRPCDQTVAMDFPGIVESHQMVFSEAGQELTAVVHHSLARDLSPAITSKWQLNGNNPVELPNVVVRFNDDPSNFCSAEPVEVNGRGGYYFDSSVTAKPWTVAAAISYLLATALPAGIDAPRLEELEALSGEVDLGAVDITGLSAAEAIAEFSRRGGLAMRAALDGYGLVIYRPGLDGSRRSISLQAEGQLFSAGATNLWKAQVAHRPRQGGQGVLAIGAVKRYESTFAMQPGWDRSLETTRWRDFVRSESPNWPVLADIFRKWVLNEHGWYSQSPWNLPTFDFSVISADDFLLSMPRKLLPCLSTDRTGQSLGVVVEIRANSSASWQRWRGPLWISRDECAVYLGGDSLPADYFQAAVARTVQLRVTCSVEADLAVTAEIAGDPALPRKILALAGRAKWAKVHTGSIFYGRTDIGTPAERDDTPLLETLAELDSQTQSPNCRAKLTLGRIDPAFSVGDIVETIEGRNWPIAPDAARLPIVRSVLHDFTSNQTTTLEVEA